MAVVVLAHGALSPLVQVAVFITLDGHVLEHGVTTVMFASTDLVRERLAEGRRVAPAETSST